MRQLLCLNCAVKQRLRAGERQTFEASLEGPAEYERVVFGTAREPLPVQRTMTIGDAVVPLDTRHFDCDVCMAPIGPGDRCVAWSAWVGVPIPPWESTFIVEDP